MFVGCVAVITFMVLSMALHNIQAQLVLLQPEQHNKYSNSLQAGWSGDQILVEARFSVPIQRALRPTQPPVQ